MVVGRREEEKRTRREETTQTPPKPHSLTVSASCPTGDTRHNASRQSISAPPSTLPHRISRITPGDPSDWDSQDPSREEDDTLQHRLYTYSNRSGEPENRRTGAEETGWSGRQRQRESEEFHSQTRSEQKHQECTKRSPTLEAVRVPRSGGGAGTLGACRTRTEARAALGSTGTAT